MKLKISKYKQKPDVIRAVLYKFSIGEVRKNMHLRPCLIFLKKKTPMKEKNNLDKNLNATN